MSKEHRNQSYLDKLKRADEQIKNGEVYEMSLSEVASLTDDLIKGYLALEAIKEEERNERNKKRRSIHGRLRRPTKRNPRRK